MLQVYVSGAPGEQIFGRGFAGVQPMPCPRGLPPAVWGPGVFACALVAAVPQVVLGEHRAGRVGDGDKGAKLFPRASSPCWVAQSLTPARAAWAPLGVTVARVARGTSQPDCDVAVCSPSRSFSGFITLYHPSPATARPLTGRAA